VERPSQRVMFLCVRCTRGCIYCDLVAFTRKTCGIREPHGWEQKKESSHDAKKKNAHRGVTCRRHRRISVDSEAA